MSQTYKFTSQVQSACKIFAVLLGLLLITIPIAIWFWLRKDSAYVIISENKIQIRGLALRETTWDFSKIRRLGVMKVAVPKAGLGGTIAKKLSGGSIAVNACAEFEDGTKKYFMVSRFENQDEILTALSTATSLDYEEVTRGMNKPKWPKQSAS